MTQVIQFYKNKEEIDHYLENNERKRIKVLLESSNISPAV